MERRKEIAEVMRKILLVLAVLSLLFLCDGQGVKAQEEPEEQNIQAKESQPVEVGNKICPVSGEEIKKGEEFQVEYEGKVYNLCCKMCVKDFNKNPEKYIEKLEELEGKEEHTGSQHHHAH